MAESAADAKFEAQKRRSARISQAVPITVTGVDALGRPFEERTSTVAVSCHGCRYQSKHYVLKNMSVALEVPHSEANREPRTVRARVTWIQRPRTVRELFQIGVELEIPGNLWGIAFPQPDWFPFPDAGESDIPAPAQFSAPPGDNLRILPVAGSDYSPSLAQQVEGLIEQARHELQTAARESAAQAVAMETAPMLAALQKQIEETAGQTVQTVVVDAANHAVQESLDKTTVAAQERLQDLQKHWDENLEASLEKAKNALLSRLTESGAERAAALKHELEPFLDQARAQITQAFQDGEAGLTQSREALSAFRQQASTVGDAAIEEMNQRLRARAEETESQWHTRLYADLSAATELWNQRIESSLESAAHKSAERLGRHSQATAERLENELGGRISSLGKVFAEATAEAEQKLGALRTSVQAETVRLQGTLVQVQSAAVGIDEHAAKFDAVTRNAQQELQRRAATVLEAQSRELARRAEGILAACTDSLRPSLEAAGQQAVARLAPQIDQELAERLKPAGQAYARLERGVAAADQALHHHQETLSRAADASVEVARGRLQETIDRVSREMEEAGRASSVKWLAEIDAKATETAHATFESLFKTADWYERKVQVQMQAALDKGLDQASAGLREKAGEISSVFASELDHYNRSYVEHAHNQLEETGNEFIERVRQQTSELAAESMSSFAQQTEVHTKAALASLHAQAAVALGEISGQVSSQLAQARADIIEEGSRLSAEFREALSSDRETASAAARQDFALLTASSVAELRNESRAQQAQLSQSMSASGDHAINEYRKRLEAASSSWLLTTVSRLDQQSRQTIQAVADGAQAQLREACFRFFAEVGENLRQRASETPAPSNAKGATASG